MSVFEEAAVGNSAVGEKVQRRVGGVRSGESRHLICLEGQYEIRSVQAVSLRRDTYT